MAGKTQTSKVRPAQATPTPPPRPSLISRILGSLWRPVPLLVTSLGLAGVLFWPQLVTYAPDLSSREEYRLAWANVSVTRANRWVPQNFIEQVRQQSELPAELCLLDEALVRQTAAAFAAHPWVAAVESVEKHQAGMSVKLRYREPAAMVQTQRGLYPVDADGVLLPPPDFTAADARLFPRIEGGRSVPQGPAGTDWGDVAVPAAARLAAVLTAGGEDCPWKRYGLEAIIVLPQPGPVASVEDVLFALTTNCGSRIVWGHAPGADALEPSVAQKLERLDKFLTENGSFEYRNAPVFIDIHDWELIRWDVLSEVQRDAAVR